LIHGVRGLNLEEFSHHRFVQSAAELGQAFRQDEVTLPGIGLDLLNATDIHHRKVRP
jgi:hypothetical protein